MTEKKKLSKRGLIFIGALMLFGCIYSWLDYFYDFTPDKNIRPGGKLFLAIPLTSLCVILIMEILRFGKDRKIYHYIAYVFAIPLIPFFIVGILSQTRLLASLTLPLMVLGILVSASTYSFQQLELLQLGDAFNQNVIPYLNLTTIAVVFVYADKFLVKLLARFIPDDQMPQAVKDITYELLDKRPFIKIAYILLTLLLIIATVEELGQSDFFHFVDPYKNVALQSLVTFAAIDRLVSKWKTDKKTTA
ncbi:MAG TPA: hypothetical protein PLQ78_03860 [Flavipsychrobacter sp.]|jgi:hypothetical protein|nr:hypothetical protein [Flavipsychrobacter sp.]